MQVYITEKPSVAKALADYVKSPSKDEIIPSALDNGVAQVVAQAVKNA